MTTLSAANGSSAARRRSRRVVINRAPEPSAVEERLSGDRRRYSAGIVDPDQFASELAVEFARRWRGGRNCAVAAISVFEIPGLLHRYGHQYVFGVVTELTDLLYRNLASNDVYHVAENGDVLVLGRDSTVADTFDRVDRIVREIASRRWDANGEALLLTPSAGLATLDDGDTAAVVVRRAIDAREVAGGHLDLRVHRWEPAMSLDTAPAEREPFDRFKWQAIKERLRAPSQIAATYVLGLVVPFCLYWLFDQVIGFDITWGMYVFCVLTLVSTGVMILVEARLAVRQKDPPDVDRYPPASAIICAYLPNEAATIMETVEAFLGQGYPGGLQVILAYNTPNPMPVERELHRLADETPNLDVVKVEGSTSKAQNVNAVLHMATGELTGMFDADHMPRPGSFERAWRWLANGYDVVQGHCLTRNGDETWLARMIAVEFESIYAVAHPGRAKLHRFGVFGGSNGYWRTDLLHETRMRGSMLTEDIDSSMRTVERGLKIRSDRDVVSRELGTTTMKQVWNQRLRWAQGWFQVTMMHTLRVWRSPGLNLRQKCGATYLLGWREVYPWLSLQVFPLVAYWYVARGQMLSTGWPILFFATVFVLHVGPHQTWYAYKLADSEIKQHTSWFWGYLAFSTLFYTEYKNTIARVAHVKEFVGERAWKVTPRSDDPVEFGDDTDDLFDDLFDDADDLETGDDDVVDEPRRVRGPLATGRAPSAGDVAEDEEVTPRLDVFSLVEHRRPPESARLSDAMVLPPQGSGPGVPLLARARTIEPGRGSVGARRDTARVPVGPVDDLDGPFHTRETLDAIQASLSLHAAAALDAIESSLSRGTDPDMPTREARSGPAGPGEPVDGAGTFDLPIRDRPSRDLPIRDRPSRDLPSGDLPSGDLPSGDLPSGDLPSGDLPSRDPGGTSPESIDDAPTLPLRRPRIPR